MAWEQCSKSIFLRQVTSYTPPLADRRGKEGKVHMVQTQTLTRAEKRAIRAARHNAEMDRDRLKGWAIANGLGRQVPRSCARHERFAGHPHIYICRNAKSLTGGYRGRTEKQGLQSAFPAIRCAF